MFYKLIYTAPNKYVCTDKVFVASDTFCSDKVIRYIEADQYHNGSLVTYMTKAIDIYEEKRKLKEFIDKI